MVEQNVFMETVKSVAEIMKVAEVPMTEQEILAYFEDMELTKEQQGYVLQYLLSPHEEEENRDEMEGKEENEAGSKEQDTSGKETLQDAEPETSEKSAVFQMYMEEITGLQKYSHTEELELYQALLLGSEDAATKLLDCWLLRVSEYAKGYMAPNLNIADLVQEGNMALYMALKQLCGSGKCDDVEAVLRTAVENGMMRYASEINGIKEAENAMIAKINLVHEAKKLLEEENGATPTMEQLAEYTKMSVQELTDLFELSEQKKEK